METGTNNIREHDYAFMHRAIELSYFAVENDHGDPFGSVIVREGNIVGEGWNKSRLLTDPSAHAEMEAVRDACKKLGTTSLKGCTVFASAQPCPMCLSLLYLSGIEKLYYCIPTEGIEKISRNLSVGYIYEALAKRPSERTIPEIQILGDQADDLIRNYKSASRSRS